MADMSYKWTEPDIPIWMDQVNCMSNSTNFLSCLNGELWGETSCYHYGNVLLTCYESGESMKTFQKYLKR